MAFDPTVHHSVKTREGTMPGRVTPYMIIGGLEGQVYLQNGKFLTPGGEVIPDDEVPEWAWQAVMGLPDVARADIGFEDFPKSKDVKGERAPREKVDLDAQLNQPTPKQLNAGDADTDGKASAVPQGQGSTDEKAQAKPAGKK